MCFKVTAAFIQDCCEWHYGEEDRHPLLALWTSLGHKLSAAKRQMYWSKLLVVLPLGTFQWERTATMGGVLVTQTLGPRHEENRLTDTGG